LIQDASARAITSEDAVTRWWAMLGAWFSAIDAPQDGLPCAIGVTST
jgi:hypothetical protein